MRLLHSAAALVAGLALAANAAAQTFSLTPGSLTVPPSIVACPPFSAAGDIYLGPLPPAMALPMGPPGCGLGYPVPGNVDAFSSAFPPPLAIPIPPGGISGAAFSVDIVATGDGMPVGLCSGPAFPGLLAPDVGSEAGAQPPTTDAPADSFFVGPNPAPLPFFGPGAMPNSQLFDGDGLPASPFFFPPAPPIGLLEPFPPGDDVDAIDPAAPATYDFVPVGGDGIPEGFLYYSVDPATAFAGGFLPAEVLVTTGGAFPAPYAAPPALGLDVVAGPGTDDIDALVVVDADGVPGLFSPGLGDVVLFSVTAFSAIVGTPDPCFLSPLFGAPIEPGDVLTEGSGLGAPGAACILIPAENVGLWSFRSCGVNPVTGVPFGDEMDALAVPEPGRLLMLAAGIAFLGLLDRGRKRGERRVALLRAARRRGR